MTDGRSRSAMGDPMGEYRRNWIARAYRNWQTSQTPIILPEATIAMGIIALVFGRSSAAAFSDLTSDTTVRFMGVMMIVGGVLISASFIKRDAFKEALGLALASLGTAVYSVSVFVALGVQGLVTGVGFAGISLVFLSRIYFIVRSFRDRKKIDDAT